MIKETWVINASPLILGEARAAAKVHSVPLVGSLGVILRARKAGLIPAARPLVEQLVESGSYLSPELIRQALIKVDEYKADAHH